MIAELCVFGAKMLIGMMFGALIFVLLGSSDRTQHPRLEI